MRTAGIFGDVTADCARDLRRWIGRVEISFRLDSVGDVQIDDAALGHNAPIVEIDFYDAIHLRSADHRRGIQRKASAGKPRARTARNESDTAAMERCENFTQLLSRAREQQYVRRAFFDGPSVALVDFQFGCARNDSAVAENFAKFVEKFAVDGAHSSFYGASISRSTLPRAALLRLVLRGHNSKVRLVFRKEIPGSDCRFRRNSRRKKVAGSFPELQTAGRVFLGPGAANLKPPRLEC